jgi:hypothetical protein
VGRGDRHHRAQLLLERLSGAVVAEAAHGRGDEASVDAAGGVPDEVDVFCALQGAARLDDLEESLGAPPQAPGGERGHAGDLDLDAGRPVVALEGLPDRPEIPDVPEGVEAEEPRDQEHVVHAPRPCSNELGRASVDWAFSRRCSGSW